MISCHALDLLTVKSCNNWRQKLFCGNLLAIYTTAMEVEINAERESANVPEENSNITMENSKNIEDLKIKGNSGANKYLSYISIHIFFFYKQKDILRNLARKNLQFR